MIFVRLFFVWTVSWWTIATATLIYGVIMWGTDPVGPSGTWFLIITMIAQPVLCVVFYLASLLQPLDLLFHRLSNWVMGR